MKTLEAAFAATFLAGVFALAGCAGSVNSCEPPCVGGAVGVLVGLGAVYPDGKDEGDGA